MSLTASLWTSVSGLLCHGEKMNVIGNNISNVNTVGFKSQRMDFQDFVYQSMGTASGAAQVGRGTNIGIIMNDFEQGALESTTGDTDIAISGTGFFCVKPKTNNTNYYTRAGNFTFDKDGFLVDPHGYVVQGWAVDNSSVASTTDGRNTKGIVGTGVPTDVRLDTFVCPPKHTTTISMPINFKMADAENNDKTTDAADPFFALLKKWDASDPEAKPLGDQSYAYPSTIEVFDEAGRSHKLTIYFDRVYDRNDATQDITDGSKDNHSWEFIVTMDPSEDNRCFGSQAGDVGSVPNVPAKLKGILGAGVLSFGPGGEVKDLSFFVPDPGPGTTPGTDDGFWDAAGNIDLNRMVEAPFSPNGYPVFSPNFSGAPGQQSAYKDGTWDKPNPDAEGHLVELNFGIRNTAKTWTWGTAMPAVGTGKGTLHSANQVKDELTASWGIDGNADMQNSRAYCQGDYFYELSGFQQDGYTYGDLYGVSVSTNGVLTARYSNGVSLQLYQLTLYDFPSKQNLRREGGNLYTETRESGVPNSGAAGTGVFGATYGRNIEQSNADIAREFVNMITTQRGFQANSKSITTVDMMLETVIQMKR